MATFKTYGHEFTIADRYNEGHACTQAEAAVLNQQMAELLSHRLRAGPFADLTRDDKPSAEQIAAAEAFLAEEAPKFQFGVRVSSGERAERDPVATEARAIARANLKAKLDAAGLRVQSKADADEGKPLAEGEYSREAYLAKLEELIKHPKIIAKAKKNVANRQIEGVEVDLAA